MTHNSTNNLNLTPKEMREQLWQAHNALEEILRSGDRVFSEMVNGEPTADELQAALNIVSLAIYQVNDQYLAAEVDDIPDPILTELAEVAQFKE